MAFSKRSRYSLMDTVTADDNGREVEIVKLRRFPAAGGRVYRVAAVDRLDVLAFKQRSDGAGFWRIADANTELEANALTRDAGRVIFVPDE